MDNADELIKNDYAFMTDDRNCGIDCLRLLSMLYVVILHTLYHGGVLESVSERTSQYNVAWILEIIAICAVDIFAMISGYVTNSNREKYPNFSKYILLWAEVVFYGLICATFIWVLDSGSVGLSDGLKAVLPVTTTQYWYFTAYTGLFFIMPVLKTYVDSCDEKQLRTMFFVLIIVFSCFDNITKVFSFHNGYSVIHLVICFLLGKIMKKCNIMRNSRTCTLLFSIVVLYIITWLWHNFGWEGEILTISIDKDLFVSYTSPTILISSIMYLALFSRIKPSASFKKAIAFLAPHAFAVYLLNDNNILRKAFIKGRFSFLANRSSLIMLITVVGFSIAFFITALLIDKLRRKLFAITHVGKLAERIDIRIERIINKLTAC